MNEYVGAATVRELAHATTVANVPLTSDAVKAFVAQLEDKKQAAADAAAGVKPKVTRPSSTKTTTPAPASTATMTAPPTSTPPTGPGSSMPGRGLRR
jgi:limonene-1,2-epoxide hydrolase